MGDYRYIGKRIREARIAANLTQLDLAKALGVRYVSLNQYELDYRSPPIEMVQKIAEITKCDPGWLLIGKATSEEDTSNSAKVEGAGLKDKSYETKEA